jgi:hypothetical protein
VEVEGVLVATVAALVVTTGLVDAVAGGIAAVFVAAGVVLVAVIAGVLEAMVATKAVDVEATRARGVVVGTGMDEVASTCADARWISKILTNARAKRARRPIPVAALMFDFIKCNVYLNIRAFHRSLR